MRYSELRLRKHKGHPNQNAASVEYPETQKRSSVSDASANGRLSVNNTGTIPVNDEQVKRTKQGRGRVHHEASGF